MRKVYSALAISIALTLASFAFYGCAQRQSVISFTGLGLGSNKFLVASTSSVTMYEENGTYLGLVADFRKYGNGLTLGGIATFSPTEFLAPLSGDNRIERANILGTSSVFSQNSQFSTTLGRIVYNPTQRYYLFVDNANTIERIDTLGGRFNGQSATPYFSGGAMAPCAAITSISGMAIDPTGTYLYVTDGTGASAGNVNRYTLGPSAPTACITASQTANSIPYGIIYHSSNRIVFTLSANIANSNKVRTCAADLTGCIDIYTNTNYISIPQALLELPDASILVSMGSTSTVNSIERMNQWGVFLSATPFLRNTFTAEGVIQMALMPGQ